MLNPQLKAKLKYNPLFKIINNLYYRWTKLSKLKYLLFTYLFIIIVSSLFLWSPITQVNPDEDWYRPKNYLNALFTVSSAFSNTGLVVYDSYLHWNILGQIFLAILILMGGLGIFVLKFYIFNFIFKRNIKTMNAYRMLQYERNHNDVNKIGSLLTTSVTFILAVSFVSGFALSFYFYYAEPIHTFGIKQNLDGYINPQGNWSLAFRFGFFHSISAINNAGFDLISGRSLMPYYQNYALQLWFIVLLIIGGLGFPVLYDLNRYIKHKLRGKKHKYRFLLFTKVSTISYFLIFLVGFGILISFETLSINANTIWNKVYVPDSLKNDYSKWVLVLNQYSQNTSEQGQLIYQELLSLPNLEDQSTLTSDVAREFFNLLNKKHLNLIKVFDSSGNLISAQEGTLKDFLTHGQMYGSTFDKVFAIIFTSLSTRSAGFATVNMRDFTRSSFFVLLIMMVIGAAPSSTGGGIRTTTFAIVYLTIVSVILNRSKVRIFKRSINPETVFMAGQVFIIGLIVLVTASFILFTSFDILGGQINTDQILLNRNFQLDATSYEAEHIWFEVASAFGTAGLSTGITKDLNIISKITLIFVMFIGQFGISSSLLVWKRKKSNQRHYEYITTDIVIG